VSSNGSYVKLSASFSRINLFHKLGNFRHCYPTWTWGLVWEDAGSSPNVFFFLKFLLFFPNGILGAQFFIFFNNDFWIYLLRYINRLILFEWLNFVMGENTTMNLSTVGNLTSKLDGSVHFLIIYGCNAANLVDSLKLLINNILLSNDLTLLLLSVHLFLFLIPQVFDLTIF
jgi:hypothetical protein